MILTFRPIKTWPDGWQRPRERKPNPFRNTSTYAGTLELLDSELRHLDTSDALLQVDADPRQVRLDGQLRADAKVAHPGVILTIETGRYGTLVYPCDTFECRWAGEPPPWQVNLRAIALGLEALRKVERYGIAERGQQYAGYRELGSGTPLGPGATVETMTVEEAARILCDATRDEIGEDPTQIARVASVANSLWREAAKAHHPDAGGDPDLFRRLTLARNLLVNL